MRFVVAIASLAALVFAASPSTASSLQRPALHVEAMSPFTVVGVHFLPRERVKVVVESGGRYARATTTSASGRFVAVFPGVSVEECTGYLVVATGNRGSRARIRLMPECPQPLQPLAA